MAKKWAKFPHPDKSYVHDAAGLKKHWARLHKGDCEPFPKDAGALEAWAGARARKGRFLEPRVKDALLEVAR